MLFLKILDVPSSNLPFLSKFHEKKILPYCPRHLRIQEIYSSANFQALNVALCFRYKFLAFDFDETVDVTKDNSRLLLVRLKMEGWVIGKSKVFLKYYHVEYLAR
jgi:hypothetical protein